MDTNVNIPTQPSIVDAQGRPFARMALDTAHDAASNIISEVTNWQPRYFSPDDELLKDRPKLLARTQDLIRNNGLASGAVQTHLDWVIGSGLELNAKPNWHLLGIEDKEQAREWERDTEAKFLAWADDPNCSCDAAGGLRFREILAQSYRSYLQAFEILEVAEWLDDDPMRDYATAIQLIDPMRLCNPNGQSNTDRLRDGVEYDAMGKPIAFHIATRLENEISTGQYRIREWKRVLAATPWGRAMIIHIFDRDRPGQSRGKNAGVVASLVKSRMHDKLGQVTLQASVLNAMFAAAIESPMDSASIGNALGVGPDKKSGLMQYALDKAAFHKEKTIQFAGVRIPHLYPGEKLSFLSPEHPTTAYEAFERSVLRYMAAGWNMPYEQLSRDYSQTNYTGFRAAMLTAWQFFAGRQVFIGGRNASAIYALWLEEAMSKGDVETPAGAPEFNDAKTAWCQCEWIGPGKGTLDPLREEEARKVRFSMGLTTMEIEAAADGRRWEDLIEQTAQEKKFIQDTEQKFGLEPGSLQPVIDGASKPMPETAENDPTHPDNVDPNNPDKQDAAEDDDESETQEQRTRRAEMPPVKTTKAGQTHIHIEHPSASKQEPDKNDVALAQIAQAIQALADNQKHLVEAVTQMQQQGMQTILDTIKAESAKPTKPIYQKNGKLAGAVKVNSIGDLLN